MFYWCLLNLPVSVRYNLCNVKLLAVSKSEFLNHENISKLFGNFIEIANELNSDGLDVVMNEKSMKIFAQVVVTLGDTLALHELGGFVVGVGTAIKFCRSCEISSVERLEDPRNMYVARDLNRHLEQLELIQDSPELIRQYGVKNASILLNINGYNVCKSMLHDPMHVLVQGVCIKELTNFLKHLQLNLSIKLEEINRRIISFDYPVIDATDRPNSIKKEQLP